VVRTTIFAILALLMSFQTASAQEWARRMFKTHQHDFGTVARGAKVEFEFEFQNVFVEDVHIAGIRTSCGCTTPIIKDGKRTYKTWEKGAIIAHLNTKAFMGYKSAAIIVTIDKPFFAEVQLNITSRIRSDVVFSPGVVELGNVDQGTEVTKKIQINYAGRNDWRIIDVRSANRNFEVELAPTQRSQGRVGYTMLVRLKKTAPAGYINDQLTIVTNDHGSKTIPLLVEGHVLSSLTVSPATFSFGQLAPGEKVTKQLVVRSKRPFKITGVVCNGSKAFEFKVPEGSKTLQLVPVTFTAGTQLGEIVQKIEIQTDLGGGTSASCTATATVKAEKP